MVGAMAGSEDLDDIDHAILGLLRDDARRTVKDIAERVNLSPAPVKRRIDRLERIGVIAGYTLVLDHSKVGPSIEAFTELEIPTRSCACGPRTSPTSSA
jgi:Lrp/AsnC family leucine-responsive transcriptional regulator